MFRNIIFDWSGVIKDCIDSHLWSVNEMMKEFGGNPIPIKELKEKWKQPYMDFWHQYFPGLTMERQKEVYFKTIERKDYPKFTSYPGIVELIKRLKREGCFVAVVSSDSPKTLLPEMEEFGLNNIFDKVITDVHDKADGVEEIINENNIDKKKTVFIGDSNHEIEVGQKFGIGTIGVTWGFTDEERLIKNNPDYLVHNIKELEEVLLK